MGFKASEHMSALTYDFGTEHTHNRTRIHGTTPEPASESVNRFTNRLANLAKEHGFDVKDPNDLAEVVEVYSKMTAEDMDAMNTETRRIMAELCDGLPTEEEIFQLKHRPFQAWLGWMQGELRDPEGGTDATRSSRALRSVG